MSLPCLRCSGTEATVVHQGTDRLYGTTAEIFRVVRCNGCGMMRLDPQPDQPSVARYYPKTYWFDPAENRASRWAERYRRIVLGDHVGFVSQIYRSAVESTGPAPMLDVGCGGGLLARMLRKKGVPALGFDLSAEACQLAWHRHGVPALTGNLLRNPFRPSSFALLTMFHLLEHLPDPPAFLSAARELLIPHGRLIVQVPNADSWQSRLLGRRWNGWDIPRHLQHFRVADLEAVLRRCGFVVERVKHFSLRDNPAGLATSLWPALDPMARRIRGLPSGLHHWAVYFAMVTASLPFAALEAAFGHGSSVMIEARKQ